MEKLFHNRSSCRETVLCLCNSFQHLVCKESGIKGLKSWTHVRSANVLSLSQNFVLWHECKAMSTLSQSICQGNFVGKKYNTPLQLLHSFRGTHTLIKGWRVNWEYFIQWLKPRFDKLVCDYCQGWMHPLHIIKTFYLTIRVTNTVLHAHKHASQKLAAWSLTFHHSSSEDTVGTSNLPLPVVVMFVLWWRARAPPGMSKGAALCVLTGAQLLLL